MKEVINKSDLQSYPLLKKIIGRKTGIRTKKTRRTDRGDNLREKEPVAGAWQNKRLFFLSF